MTLDAVGGDPADNFPRDQLAGAKTGLCVFAAAFHGRQDAFWLAKAGVKGTCVDTDAGKLEEMRVVYPDGWEFVTADAYEWVDRTRRKWDVVTVDCKTADFDRCAAMTDVWCRLARDLVVLGTGRRTVMPDVMPEGWSVVDVRKRSDFKGGVYWTVIRRDR